MVRITYEKLLYALLKYPKLKLSSVGESVIPLYKGDVHALGSIFVPLGLECLRYTIPLNIYAFPDFVNGL